MARKLRPLRIDSHIGLGNTAKNLRGHLVRAFCKTIDSKIRAAINRVLTPLEIFRHEKESEIVMRIPRIENPNNIAPKVYYGEGPLSDLEAEELQRLEDPLTRYGIVVPKPDDEGE